MKPKLVDFINGRPFQGGSVKNKGKRGIIDTILSLMSDRILFILTYLNYLVFFVVYLHNQFKSKEPYRSRHHGIQGKTFQYHF